MQISMVCCKYVIVHMQLNCVDWSWSGLTVQLEYKPYTVGVKIKFPFSFRRTKTVHRTNKKQLQNQ